ncbi:MAG: ATP synthase F1 subunit delta [Myxococcales bacterium]|nr:ATP synthase F1 subunit delta [Myxococcales bacterium]
MSAGSISRRYATALIELADDKKLLDKVGQELAEFHALLLENAELRDLLENPSVAVRDKQSVVRELASRGSFSTIATHALIVMIDNQRLDALEDIIREYTHAVDAKKGVLRVVAVASVALNKTHVMKIRYVLQNLTGKTIEIDTREDPDLIAGIRLHVGSLVIDGSIQSQLRNLKHELLTAN